MHAGLMDNLPKQALIEGKAAVAIRKKGAANIAPPFQPGAKLMVDIELHLLNGYRFYLG
jgi:hypothetical protein